MPSHYNGWFVAASTIIEFLAAITIGFHVLWALWVILRRGGTDRPRLIIADGVLGALAFSVAATLLKTLLLQNWHQIGMFAFIFGLRSMLKRVFAFEKRRVMERIQAMPQ